MIGYPYYPYYSELIHRYWGNNEIVRVTVKVLGNIEIYEYEWNTKQQQHHHTATELRDTFQHFGC